MMKRLGIAATLSVAANAYALGPNDSPDIEIFMSGASAQDGNIETLFEQLCVPGTLDIYRDNSSASSPGKAHRAIFCNVDNTKVDGLSLTNPKVLFHKRSAGGSAQGVNPLLDDQPIDAMMINNGNCTRVGATREFLCSINNAGDLAPVISTAGVSDVNPELFVRFNTPEGFSEVDPVKVFQTLDVSGAAALVFGIPVTTGLRDALQEVQINAGRLAENCIGDNTQRCMPNLSKHQVASIMSGQVLHWNQLTAADSTGALVPFTAALASVSPPDNIRVAICRRVDGSGTQAQMNANFLHAPCTGVALPPAEVSNPLQGPVIVKNEGSGDLDLCLDDFNNGTNSGGGNQGEQTFWAVGLQSTEKNPDLAHDYRFIKIDGYAPTLQNAAHGDYLDWAENTYQWKKQGQPNAPSAEQLAILETVARNAAGPAILGPLNLSKFVHPWGVGGYLALSVNGHALGANGEFRLNNPVTPYTHRPLTYRTLSNCRVPVYDRFARDIDGKHVLPL